MNCFKKIIITLLAKTESLSAIACRLTKLTGKSNYNVHPKHLVGKNFFWYLPYLKKNYLVLDAGCGNAEHSFKLAKKSRQVIAFDIDKKLLGQAKKKIKDDKIKNIQLLNINANEKLPFKDNYFDLILCHDLLEHLKNYKKSLKEFIRVLKNNGFLLLTLPNKETTWKKLKKAAGLFYFSDKGHVKEWNLKEINNFSKKLPLKVIKKEPIVYDTPLTGFIDLLGGINLFLYTKVLNWKRKKALEKPQESTGFSLVLKKN